MALEQDERVSAVVEREQSRLRGFIRRRVPDPRDVEDILQDVFYELVEANRLLMPIDHVTGWLFRVARNRVTDLFRRKKPESFSDAAVADEDDELLRFEDLLPSPDAGPEALYARGALLDELALAVGELPREQREVYRGEIASRHQVSFLNLPSNRSSNKCTHNFDANSAISRILLTFHNGIAIIFIVMENHDIHTSVSRCLCQNHSKPARAKHISV